MVAELDTDLKFLYKKWQTLCKQSKKAKSPQDFGELSRTTSLLRDVLNDEFTSVLVNNEKLFNEIRLHSYYISRTTKNSSTLQR